MASRVALIASVITVLTGLVVLAGWVLGTSAAASVVAGWRVMVPSTAFGFVCIGFGLALSNTAGRAAAWVRTLAFVASVIPVLTLAEYASGARWGVESWLGVSFGNPPVDPFAGRMSAITAFCFTLLAAALASLTWAGPWATRIVRFGGGIVVAMSWIAVVAVSFDDTRLADRPSFPGMAVLTIVLFGVAGTGVLACSAQVLARLRDVDADVVVPRRLVAATFLVPLVLGQVRAALETRIDPGLATALVAIAFAATITMLAWSIAARMQSLRQQRNAVLTELERRVEARTTELAGVNEQLRQREERLREADRRKDEFLATLAHELRNPLASIRTGFYILQNPQTSGAARERIDGIIGRQLEHLVRLIDDLLDVSRITAGKLDLRRERVDIGDVVRHAVESMRTGLDAARLTLVVDVPEPSGAVMGDATRLSQVVVNLLQNARKYTPAGGRVEVSLRTGSTVARISVRDSGIGIPPAFLPHLFHKFSQLTTAERTEGGLGLGLSLARSIVTLHGGTIAAHSDGENRGSEFVITLPLAPPEAPLPPPATQAMAIPDRALETARRVLVADDNADNAEALAILLRQRGHEVEIAADGVTALAAAERFRPHVMFLDIGMPKLNGYDVCRQVRRATWGRGMRVFAQTGWGQMQDRRRSQEAGFDDHLVKPVDPAQLDALLR